MGVRTDVSLIVAPVSTSSVLIAPDHADTDPTARPRYTLLLTTEPDHIEAAQRLRQEVFSTEPGFAVDSTGSLDADRFDEYCDHLLVREEHTGDLVGCYRMLPPPGAIAAGGLYTATEFDIHALDPLRASMVEMGRAVVRADHRNGAVVLMMWTGILAYLDRCGYDYVTGCVSVPVLGEGDPGSQIRGVRDVVRARHSAAPELTVYPHRPVIVDDVALEDIPAPERLTMPPLLRGYLRLGAQICGEPAHDPDFGVADFPALLDKRRVDIRYLTRLRSAAAHAGRQSGHQHTDVH